MIGTYWFEDGKGRTVTTNQENYHKVIRRFYAFVSSRRGIVINQPWCKPKNTSGSKGNNHKIY